MSGKLRWFSIVLLVTALLLFWMWNSERRTPVTYVIPSGYSGRIIVVYDVSGARALPKQKGRYIAEIPPDGVLLTSTSQDFGLAKDRFIDDKDREIGNAYKPDGYGVRGGVGSNCRDHDYISYFVGKLQDLEMDKDPWVAQSMVHTALEKNGTQGGRSK